MWKITSLCTCVCVCVSLPISQSGINVWMECHYCLHHLLSMYRWGPIWSWRFRMGGTRLLLPLLLLVFAIKAYLKATCDYLRKHSFEWAPLKLSLFFPSFFFWLLIYIIFMIVNGYPNLLIRHSIMEMIENTVAGLRREGKL